MKTPVPGADILREIRIRYPYAKKVLDAKQPLGFVMSAEHMTGCKRNDSAHCPVHKRLNEFLQLPTSVLHSTAYVVHPSGDVVRYKFEGKLRNAIQTYDGGSKFPFGEFSLVPPKNSERIGRPHPKKSFGGHSKTKMRSTLRRAVRRHIDQ
jgi:hypothetical protein